MYKFLCPSTIKPVNWGIVTLKVANPSNGSLNHSEIFRKFSFLAPVLTPRQGDFDACLKIMFPPFLHQETRRRLLTTISSISAQTQVRIKLYLVSR